MKIGLVSERSLNNNINKNVETILNIIKTSKNFDLLLFSESFIHGFNGLTWIYERDICIAMNQESTLIKKIMMTCKEHNIAVGFGYFEKMKEDIYCSYLIIDKNGEIIHNYRRLSIGWKEYTKTTLNYREGYELISFQLEEKYGTVVLCGDLWDDAIKMKLSEVVEHDGCDFVIWPNHLDYLPEQFDQELNDYQKQTIGISVPIFLINDHSETSCGGAVAFYNGKIISKLPSGVIGILEFTI